MTIKELFDSVTFEEVMPFLIKSEYDKCKLLMKNNMLYVMKSLSRAPLAIVDG